jgi:hypothetical protein
MRNINVFAVFPTFPGDFLISLLDLSFYSELNKKIKKDPKARKVTL